MNDEARSPGWGAIGAALLVIGAILLVGFVFVGGHTSTILSNVGNSVGPPQIVGNAVDGGSVEETPDDPTGGEVADAGARAPDLLIVRTGTLEVVVQDLAVAVGAGRDRIVGLGGYVSASDESASGDDAGASAVYRIPADRWEDGLEAIRGLATETRRLQVATEAVTGQVVDLGARIANLRASEAALQAIMTQAAKISDVLDVQAQLTDTRGEIERLVAEKTLLEERAAFGTLTVVFQLPTTPAVDTARKGWNPASDVDQASSRLIAIGQAGVSVAIWLGIVGLPLLIAAAFIVGIGWRLVRFASRWFGPQPDVPPA